MLMYHVKNILFCLAFTICFSHVALAEKVLHRVSVGEPESMDPHYFQSRWTENVLRELFEGLVTAGPEGEILPGVAHSWTLSKDKTTYIFHLDKNALWSDGTPITAHDFVFAFRRLLDPQTLALQAELMYPILHAKAIHRGALGPDALGVMAIQDHILRIDLESPAPFFLEILAHPKAAPLPKHHLKQWGKDWTKGSWVSNGPYVLVEWLPHQFVELSKNNRYTKHHGNIDRIFFDTVERQETSLLRFRAGELHIIEDIPIHQMDWVKTHLSENVRYESYLGIQYLVFNTHVPPFHDARVRQALSMVIDRDKISEKIMQLNRASAYQFVPAGMPFYEAAKADFHLLSFEERVTKAKSLLQEAGYDKDFPLEIELSYNKNENYEKMAIAIGALWKDDLNIEVKLKSFDTKTLYQVLRDGDFQVARASWIADYADPQNFLEIFAQENNSANFSRYTSERYSQLITKATKEQHKKKRMSYFQEAESILMQEHPVAPLYFNTRTYLIHKNIQGWKPNAKSIHPVRFISLVDK